MDWPHVRGIDARIDEVELFRLDVHKPRHFSFGTWRNRQHAVLKLSVGSFRGWSEAICSRNDPDFDLLHWGMRFRQLKGLTISQALAHLLSQRGVWPVSTLEMAEMALLDLAGRVREMLVTDLLGLDGREPVPGLFCILEDDPRQAEAQAHLALERNLRTHVKVKIFGDNRLDVLLIQAVRGVMGSDAYVTADANSGYRHQPGEPLDELARELRTLREAGLDACEDPAKLENNEWVLLQERVGDLTLIPDSPTRPAWEAIHTLIPNMGRVYNLHPAGMGSMLSSVVLGRKIRSFGADVIIGDDSLIGPACTAWQQIAIGLGGEWMEALEKPEESDDFLRCIVGQATSQEADGRFGLRERRPGFGLDVDETSLRARCASHGAL